MDGWMGKALKIDLRERSAEIENLPGRAELNFLGGRGLGDYILAERLNPDVDPLSPENILVAAVGPLTATVVPTTGRMAMISKSPLTGTIFDSNAGGHWGPALKKAGFDALIIRGSCDELHRIEIYENDVKIIPCPELREKSTTSTWRSLQEKASDYRHLSIGPAGENEVRFASVAVGKNGTLGRGGLGAVLGSKNIKAISVRGDKKPGIADEKEVDSVKKKSRAWLEDSSLTEGRLRELGTAMLMNLINEAGVLPTHNFQKTQFDLADRISGENIARKLPSTSSSCYNCPITCSRNITGGEEEKSSPEFESLGLLGANLGLSDPDFVTELNQLCDELGLDTISTGSVLSCYIEMSDKGYIDSPLSFGSREKIDEYIELIAFREGIGDELAEGSLRFASEYGASELSMQVKGLDIPAFDPRGMKGQALGYITSNRGACHQRANMMTWELLGIPENVDRFSEDDKAPLVVHQQNLNAILDSLIVCKFTLFALAEGFYREMLNAVTGADLSEGEFMKIGRRIWNLERLYNLAAGFRRRDDSLPLRFKQEKGSGPAAEVIVNEKKMLDSYYQKRGWDKRGFPLPDKLSELDLEKFSGLLPGGGGHDV